MISLTKTITVIFTLTSMLLTYSSPALSFGGDKDKNKGRILSSSGGGDSFHKGQIDLNLGLGLGNGIVGGGSTNVIPPLSASLDYGITDDISIGGYLGFTGAQYVYTGWEDCRGLGYGSYYTDTYRWTYFIVGARGSYHFGRFIKIEKLDVYAGLMLGNTFTSSSYTTTSQCPDHIGYKNPTYGGFIFSLYGGARYRFTDRFGVFGEVGYGVAYLNIGINFKF